MQWVPVGDGNFSCLNAVTTDNCWTFLGLCLLMWTPLQPAKNNQDFSTGNAMWWIWFRWIWTTVAPLSEWSTLPCSDQISTDANAALSWLLRPVFCHVHPRVYRIVSPLAFLLLTKIDIPGYWTPCWAQNNVFPSFKFNESWNISWKYEISYQMILKIKAVSALLAVQGDP